MLTYKHHEKISRCTTLHILVKCVGLVLLRRKSYFLYGKGGKVGICVAKSLVSTFFTGCTTNSIRFFCQVSEISRHENAHTQMSTKPQTIYEEPFAFRWFVNAVHVPHYMKTLTDNHPPKITFVTEWEILCCHMKCLTDAHLTKNSARSVLYHSRVFEQSLRQKLLTCNGLISEWIQSPNQVDTFESHIHDLIYVMILRLDSTIDTYANDRRILTQMEQMPTTRNASSPSYLGRYLPIHLDEAFHSVSTHMQKERGFITAVHAEQPLMLVIPIAVIVDYILVLLRDAYFDYEHVPLTSSSSSSSSSSS